jgi:hypothetical protein
VKDDAHGAFTPEMMKLPQTTWIETVVEGVTDEEWPITGGRRTKPPQVEESLQIYKLLF